MSTRYNTGNPIESTDVRDMSDNAKNFDDFANSKSNEFTDRFGVERKTIHGMNSQFDSNILNMGFTRVGTFAAGATLTNPRQTLLWDVADGGDGHEYGWSGAFPKIVPATSTPASTGGISVGAWISRFDPELRIQVREALRRSYAEAGYNLVDGSFEAGGAVTAVTDVLLYETEGKAYSWGGVTPKNVPAGSTPASSGGIGAAAWIDRSSAKNAFIQDGPDAVHRTAQDKMRDIIDARDFGALFDGVNDDTDGINKAIKSKGPSSWLTVQFPSGGKGKILGTVLIPTGVRIDMNGCRINGSGTNVMFESGKWSGGDVVSNFADAPQESLIVDAGVGNGLISKCRTGVKVNNFVAGCRIHDIRADLVEQILHEKYSFYCEFSNMLAWAPVDGTLLPCFHWQGAVQAMGVRKCYAAGYAVGHRIQGPGDTDSFDTCSAESCTVGLELTGTANAGGGLAGLRLRNWYFENNGDAIKADTAFNYENIDIDNCFFNANYNILSGRTIYSGRFGRLNRVVSTVEKPGNFDLTTNTAGFSGFILELPEIADSTNRISPTIDTNNKYFVGPNVRIERVVTVTDINSVPYARNRETPNLPVLDITGNQFGNIPNNTVPFCETYHEAGFVIVKTQIPYQAFSMLAYNINVVDSQGSWFVRGIVMGDQIFPLSSTQKQVTLSNGGGLTQIKIGTLNGVISYKGGVKLL